MQTCPSCATANPDAAAFCDNCGALLTRVASQSKASSAPSKLGVLCPQCATPVMLGEAFCENCGAPLGDLPIVRPGVTQAHMQKPALDTSETQPSPIALHTRQAPVDPAVTHPGASNCPVCGRVASPGATFCDSCGAYLGESMSGHPTRPSLENVKYQGEGPRLIVVTTNSVIPFPAGQAENVIGREDPVSNIFPDIDLGPHDGEEGGVSRRHAVINLQDAEWYVEDLNSTNFTYVNNDRLDLGHVYPLHSGDQIRLGKVVLTFVSD